MKRVMLFALTVIFVGLLSPTLALAADCTRTADPTPLKASDDAKTTPSTILGKACDYNADFIGCNGKQSLERDCGGGSKTSLIQAIVNTLLYASGIVAFGFILLGGFRYMTSTGDSGRIQGAKDTLLYAIIGLIVTALALPISGFIIKTVAGG